MPIACTTGMQRSHSSGCAPLRPTCRDKETNTDELLWRCWPQRPLAAQPQSWLAGGDCPTLVPRGPTREEKFQQRSHLAPPAGATPMDTATDGSAGLSCSEAEAA